MVQARGFIRGINRKHLKSQIPEFIRSVNQKSLHPKSKIQNLKYKIE